MYPTEPAHLHEENRGFFSLTSDIQQNLHLLSSSSATLSSTYIMDSTSSYSSKSSSHLFADSYFFVVYSMSSITYSSYSSLYLISLTANLTLPTFKISPYYMSYSYSINDYGNNAYYLRIIVFERTNN